MVQTQINFLDVTVSLENGKIETDLYVKPTDIHLHLHSSSCHPYHWKNGIQTEFKRKSNAPPQ